MKNKKQEEKKLGKKHYLDRSTPENEGISSDAIINFLDAVEKEEFELHSFMLLRNKKVIAEGAWSPYNLETKHYMLSVTKSVTSTAVGFAISEGLLSLDDKVVSFFPEYHDLDMDKKMGSMTIRHLLTMTSGYIENIPGSSVWNHIKDSWIKEFLELPLTHEPGTRFIYNSGSSHMLSAIVTKVTKESISNYLQPRLFKPLEIKDCIWDTDPNGNNTGGWGIRFSTEDLAKFGQFYLQNGVWGDKQLLPKGWVEQATSYQVSTSHEDSPTMRYGYGYQFWMSHNGSYRAFGRFGQTCIVLPQQNAVIAISAGMDQGEDIMDLVWEYLYPYFQADSLEKNIKDQEQLETRLNNLTLFTKQPYSWTPMANIVTGKKYKMKSNVDEIDSVQFDFSSESCLFTLFDSRGEKHQIECGIGDWIEGATTLPGAILHYMLQPDDLRVKAKGIWKNKKTFIMTWTYYNMPFTDTVTCYFEGSKLIFMRHANVHRETDRPTIIGVSQR